MAQIGKPVGRRSRTVGYVGGAAVAAVVIGTSIFNDGFDRPAEPGAPVPFVCNAPLIKPPGFASRVVTWAQLFTPKDGSPKPTYPNSNGFPVPIGAEKGSYTAAWFIAQPNQTVSMFWDPAQAKPSEGYAAARPAIGMYLSISPCAGDLRPSDNSGGFLMAGCRKFANTGSLIWSTRITTSTQSACALKAGDRYFLNVTPYNPHAGLDLALHMCSQAPTSANGCDVQARQTGK